MFRRACAALALAVFMALGGTAVSASAASLQSAVPSYGAAVVAASPSTDDVPEPATEVRETPVAEESSTAETPVILVTGLAVLLAAILMVIRSGSSIRADES